jgi:uncharacterized protein
VNQPVSTLVMIRVIPRASKTKITGERDGALVIRVAAPPVEGAANDALVDFFAKALRLPRGAIAIVAGEHSRLKRLSISGATLDEIRALARRG